MTITGINHITFSVSNLQASLDFYIDLLGLSPVYTWDQGAYLTAGDVWIALNQETQCKRVPQETYTHIAFQVTPSDLQALKNKLLDAGVKSFKNNTSEGDSFYFLDPDGHKLELHANTRKDRLKAITKDKYSGG